MLDLDDNIGRAADPRLIRPGSAATVRTHLLARIIERGRMRRPAAGHLARLHMRMVRRSPLIGAATVAQALMRRFQRSESGSSRELTLLARIASQELGEYDADQAALESWFGRTPIAQPVL